MFKRTVIFTMACCLTSPLFTSCGEDVSSSGTACLDGCPEGQHCDAVSAVCVADSPVVEKNCAEECGEGRHCDKSVGECVDDTPAEKNCPEACGEGRHCDKSVGECVDDTPAEKNCPEACGEGRHCDKSVGECVDDAPTEKNCPEACGEGRHCDKSVGECVDDAPTEIECTEACGEGRHCDKSVGECVVDTPTEIECAEDCGEGRHCDKSVGECVDDVEKECSEECSLHYHCDKSVGECIADEKDCDTEGQLSCSDALLMKCGEDGYFEIVEDCAENAQEAKACFDDGENGYGCYVSECTPDETKCDGSKILKCNALHKYVDDSDCADIAETPLCDEIGGSALCTARCEAGSSRCDHNQVEICNSESGKYEVSGDCPEDEGVCRLDNNGNALCVKFECKEGDSRCKGDTVEKCKDGFFNASSDCSEIGYICKEEDGASCREVECTGSETKCVNEKWLFACNNGFFDQTDCVSAFVSNGNEGKCVTNAETGVSSCVEIKPVADDYDESKDQDKDTIMDGVESCTNDQDKDELVDCKDTDSDGDTIPDKLEADNNGGKSEPGDADYDGIPNYLDLDSDGNGISDSAECCGKDAACLAAKDEKGFFTYCIDTDGDTVPDFLDYDNDDDGFDDTKEIKGMVINPPAPEAGVFSGYGCKNGNAFGTPDKPVDCDADTIPDYMDFDSDNDGLCDDFEGLVRMNVTGKDGKKHGAYSRYSPDTDSDNIGDALEAYGALTIPSSVKKDEHGCYTFTSSKDADNDGIINQLEIDSDDDGLTDLFETMCCDLNILNDAQKAECAKRNNWCTNPYKADSDGDGVTDLIEYGAETNPNNADDNPQNKGNFVFRAPYQEATTPKSESLALELSIQTIDIFINFDQSSSTKDEAQKLNEKLPLIFKDLQCEDLKKACVENSECSGLKTAAGNNADAICSEKGRCIVNPKSGDGCFDDMEVGLGYYSYIDSFWVAVAMGEKQDTAKGTLSNVDTVVTALQRYYPKGNYEVAFQAPICAAEGISNNCKITNSNWKQTNICKPASDACAKQYYTSESNKKGITGCYSECKRNCVDLTANPDRETCVGYRKSAIRMYAQVFDEEQCLYNNTDSISYTTRCNGFFENVGNIMKSNKMRWIGLQSASSKSYCTVSPKTSSTASSVKCIDGLCEKTCSSSNTLTMSAVSDYIGKQSGSTKADGTAYTYAATGEDIDTQFTSGVREIAKSMPMDITALVEDLDNKDNLNASKLVESLSVHITGGKAQGRNCFTVPSDKIVPGTFEGIDQIAPIDVTDGYSVCYDVIPVQNQTVFPALDVPQVKKAKVTVYGDGSPLNSGIAYFLIPPKIENNTGEIGG